jgi:hypothetical protein
MSARQTQDSVAKDGSPILGLPRSRKGAWDVDVWTLPAAIFFCTMGMFAGAAALYLTGTRVRLLGHQAAEIVLFCLLIAIAVFAVIAAAYP